MLRLILAPGMGGLCLPKRDHARAKIEYGHCSGCSLPEGGRLASPALPDEAYTDHGQRRLAGDLPIRQLLLQVLPPTLFHIAQMEKVEKDWWFVCAC